jgi:heme exporter protein D
MSWGSVGEFLHMGGYGLYVWGSYGVTLAALALETWMLLRRARMTVRSLQREAGRRGRR